MRISKIFCLALLLFWSAAAHSAPSFGRFLGVLRHDRIDQDQLARLDIIAEQPTIGSVPKLRATLVLYFGDYSSDEYASYDYHDVTYNPATGALVFSTSDRQLLIVVDHFAGDRIDAEVRTGHGSVGRLLLNRDTKFNVQRPLVQKIWGEYRGVCDGVGRRLQVQSSPAQPIGTTRTDPFAPFVIMAQLGDNGGPSCLTGAGTCVTKVYYSGDYDFYLGHVDFHGDYGSLTCSVNTDGLVCGGCSLRRTSDERVDSGPVEFTNHDPAWDLLPGNRSSGAGIEGTYVGYAHLDHRDIYMPMRVVVSSYQNDQDANDAQLMVSVVSTISFGGHTETDESVSNKFDPKPMRVLGSQPVFERADRTTDTMLKFQSIGDGVIRGTWYSRRFGFVGEFLVATSGRVELREPAKLDAPLSGRFSNGKLDIELVVAMSDVAVTSRDPFAPLILQGHVRYAEMTGRKPFSDTAFDPFTGKFALDTEGLGGAYIGTRTSRGIRIKIPNQGVHRAMQRHRFVELFDSER